MKLLTSAQREQYREQGYVSPVRVMSVAKAESIRSQMEAFEKSQGGLKVKESKTSVCAGGHFGSACHKLGFL